MRILITGANGFVGSHLAASYSKNEDVKLMVRQASGDHREVLADLMDTESLAKACLGVDIVIHCAGFAHAFGLSSEEEAKIHHEVNFQGACNMAEIAAAAGVKRFIFLSSVKAVSDPPEQCVDESYDGEPSSFYGRAKRNAEHVLLALSRKSDMEVVCLRPVMVYGPKGQGNLTRMVESIRKGYFPPLPEVGNKRSVLHIDDLVAAIRLVSESPKVAGETYIVADPVGYSGRMIYNLIREALGLPPVRWSVPALILRKAARLGDGLHLSFNSQVLERLLGTSFFSSAKLQRDLGWRVQKDLRQGLNYLNKDPS